MCSKYYRLNAKEIDEIFDVDVTLPQLNNDCESLVNNRQVSSTDIALRWSVETALQTPKHTQNIDADLQISKQPQHIPRANNSDSAVGTEITSTILGATEDLLHRVSEENSDSAVGTVSQLTKNDAESSQSLPIFINRIDDFQSQASPFQPPMTQENPHFRVASSQDMFSQCLVTPSFNETFYDRPHECSNVYQSSNDNFVNFVASFDSGQSGQQEFTNDTSLANHSFYSLMQRSLMKDNLQQPCSSVQLALVTPSVTQAYSTQDEVFSQFLNSAPFAGSSYNNTSSNEIFYANGSSDHSNDDSHRRRNGENSEFECEDQQTVCSILDAHAQSQGGNSFQDQHDAQSQAQHSSNEFQNQSISPPVIPRSILDLHEQIKSTGLTDWSFVYALAAQTCQELLPMNYDITLKISLLLSIASIDASTGVAPIPIVAVGRDSSSANSIMNCIGNFAQRFLAPTDHTFNVSINSQKVVEIGPVFLAKNGVCYLGDWSGLSKKVSDEIKILIDSGRYFLNETSENFQLGSALWTYWSSMQSKKDFANVAIFVKYFGIPIMTDLHESDDIVEFLLIEAKDGKLDIPNDILNISSDDMKKYLNIVRKIKVRKTDEAQQLLKAYSDAIQADRAGLLSARSVQVIQQMAESFAKLCLRDKVLIRDVVSAISIAEKTFYAITGIPGGPLLAPTQDIETVDQYIESFHKWIFSYVGML